MDHQDWKTVIFTKDYQKEYTPEQIKAFEEKQKVGIFLKIHNIKIT